MTPCALPRGTSRRSRRVPRRVLTYQEPVRQEVEAWQEKPAVGARVVLVVDDVSFADRLIAVGGRRGIVTFLQDTLGGVQHRVIQRTLRWNVRRPRVEIHGTRHRDWLLKCLPLSLSSSSTGTRNQD